MEGDSLWRLERLIELGSIDEQSINGEVDRYRNAAIFGAGLAAALAAIGVPAGRDSLGAYVLAFAMYILSVVVAGVVLFRDRRSLARAAPAPAAVLVLIEQAENEAKPDPSRIDELAQEYVDALTDAVVEKMAYAARAEEVLEELRPWLVTQGVLLLFGLTLTAIAVGTTASGTAA